MALTSVDARDLHGRIERTNNVKRGGWSWTVKTARDNRKNAKRRRVQGENRTQKGKDWSRKSRKSQENRVNVQKVKNERKKEKKKYSTPYSRVVSHRSTDDAIASLTSEIGRDPVLSRMYGRTWLENVTETHVPTKFWTLKTDNGARETLIKSRTTSLQSESKHHNGQDELFNAPKKWIFEICTRKIK